YGTRASLLRRLPQADPQGRGRGGLRRRQPGGAHGGEHREPPEPQGQPRRAGLRLRKNPAGGAIQQARPPQRRAGGGVAEPPQPEHGARLRGRGLQGRRRLRDAEGDRQAGADGAQEGQVIAGLALASVLAAAAAKSYAPEAVPRIAIFPRSIKVGGNGACEVQIEMPTRGGTPEISAAVGSV